MKNKFPKVCLALVLVLIGKTIVIPNQAPAQDISVKWFPGHYVHIRHVGFDGEGSLNNRLVNENVRNLVKDNPYIMGYKIQTVWREIEVSKDQYDFSVIQSILKLAESDGKKVMIHIQDRFVPESGLPEYMMSAEYEGGYFKSTPPFFPGVDFGKVWLPQYQYRWNRFIKAMGEALDDNPILAGVMVSESAFSRDDPGYNKEGHLNWLISMHATAAKYFPKTPFFQYVNWGFPSAEDRDHLMKQIVEVSKNGFGGPDLHDRKPQSCLTMQFGSYYDKYRGVAPICTENQPSGYRHYDARYKFNFAVDTVGVNFLPWTPVLDTSELVKWTFYDALEVINQEEGRINTTPPSNIIDKRKIAR